VKKTELALLVHERYPSSKHSGILGYFNMRFVKEKIFPEDLGCAVNSAFELRQRSDYREYFKLSYETLEPYIDKVRIFLTTIGDYLSRK